MAGNPRRRTTVRRNTIVLAILLIAGAVFPLSWCRGQQNDRGAVSSVGSDIGLFRRSELKSSTGSLWEGDGIDYTLIIRYEGETEPAEITLAFPLPYPTMLISASSELDFVEAERELRWQGMVWPGRDLVFTISLITLPESGSSRSIPASAGIYAAGGVHWLQSDTEIHAKPDVSPATLLKYILGYLIAGISLILGIPWMIRWRQKNRLLAAGRGEKESSDTILLYAMSFGIFAALGVAHFIGFIAWQDYRRYAVFEQSRCTVLDKRIILEKKSRTPGQTQSSDSWFNEPQVAVRYRAEDREIIAAGPTQVTSMRSISEKSALRELARYERGKVYPCWFDPQQPRSFVLSRGLSWGWYLIGAGPLIVLVFLGRALLRKI